MRLSAKLKTDHSHWALPARKNLDGCNEKIKTAILTQQSLEKSL